MSSRQLLDRLRESAPVILPSLLLCDFGNLEREIRQLERSGADGLHLDVMDGHFVPNLTYGMPVVEACRRLTDLPLDVHLMISHPAPFLDAFLDAGANMVTVHIESAGDVAQILKQIRGRGACAGLALNPDTPVEAIQPYLGMCDLLLVMSVHAGFGGQAFNPVALQKLAYLRSIVTEGLCLEVDGGINTTTISPCAAAGAELFVVGSAIFRQHEYATAIGQLRSAATHGLGR